MRIVAIDPGKSTGLCYSRNEDHLSFSTLTEGDHHRELYDFLSMFNPDVILLESFKWRPKYAELISLEYIGVVRMWWQQWEWSHRQLLMRRPDEAKVFATDNKLKQLGYWKGFTTHERDAFRHWLCYQCLDQKSQLWIDRLKP